MALLLPDKWIWDFWLAEDAGVQHLFMLQADKAIGDPDQRHWHVSVGHAVSTDLRDWEYRGTVLAPNPDPGFDDATVWTGSVIRHGDEWLMFYTGNSRASNCKVQRIGLARSRDLERWTRDPGNPLVDNLPAPYENMHYPERWHDRSLRDPDVSPDPVRGGWRMFFAARVMDRDADAAGCIGQAWSANLTDWEVLPPAAAPGIAGELEVPQRVELNGRWYLLFCTASNRFGRAFAAANPAAASMTGTHYFIADAPDGPWRLGAGLFFAGDGKGGMYAGKIVRQGGMPYFLAFLNKDAEGNFVGGLSDPIPVAVAADGALSLPHG